MLTYFRHTLGLYSASPLPPRGREPVAPAAGKGPAPAGVARSHALGRPWPAVRPHYGGLPSMAGRGGRRRAAEAARIGGPSRAPSPPGSYGARDRNRRDGAPRGATRSEKPRAQTDWLRPWARRPPRLFAGVETPAPGDVKGGAKLGRDPRRENDGVCLDETITTRVARSSPTARDGPICRWRRTRPLWQHAGCRQIKGPHAMSQTQHRPRAERGRNPPPRRVRRSAGDRGGNGQTECGRPDASLCPDLHSVRAKLARAARIS